MTTKLYTQGPKTLLTDGEEFWLSFSDPRPDSPSELDPYVWLRHGVWVSVAKRSKVRSALAKHASPTHGTGTTQKVHGNWAHPGYTDLLDPKSGDLHIVPGTGNSPFTQTALFHPDLFDTPTKLPTPHNAKDPELAHPFTRAPVHPAAFERMDGKKFKFIFVDGPVLSDGITPVRNNRLPGYLDNFRDVTPAQAVIEMKAMREHLYEVEQYGLSVMKKKRDLVVGPSSSNPLTSEQKVEHNRLTDQQEATRNEITAVFAHMDQMAGRALPEIERIGTEVHDKVRKAWVKAHGDLGLDTKGGTGVVGNTLQRANVRNATPDEIIKAFPHDRQLQDLYDDYGKAMAVPVTAIPDPKSLSIPDWVKVPRNYTDARWPERADNPVSLNRWAAEKLLDWHNSQDFLPAEPRWRQTDGNPETAPFRWVKRVDYKIMVEEAVRLQRANARSKHSVRGLREIGALRDRAHALLPDRRKVVHDILKTYRPFGGEIETLNKRTGKGLKHLNSESAYIPSDWIDISNHYGNLLVYSSKTRGHYNHDYKDAWVSRLQAEVGVGGREHVTLHEFAHRVEHTNPMVTALERHFYDKRTKGESLQYLQKLQPGHNYKAYEQARPDEFINPYKGKAYGQRGSYKTHRRSGQYWPTEAYELLSMGIYEAYTNKYSADTDFMSFIYGTMVTA